MFILFALLAVASTQEISEDYKSHPNWKLLDLGEDCGQTMSERIIGGTNASLGQYPWIARLGYTYGIQAEGESKKVDIYECGGAIINNRYILTAAHCSSENVNYELIEIRLGEYDVKTEIDCRNGACAPPPQDIRIENYTCSAAYNKKTYQNDICLIRLVEPIKFNDYVSPICLPFYDTLRENEFEGAVMEVAGWGATDIYTKKTSEVLMTLKVPVLPRSRCVKSYAGKAIITEKQICAGGVIGKDSCSGDSGGPLMKPFSLNAPPRYFAIGIVSFGPRSCADTDTPGVYTKVSGHLKWILDTIKE